MLSVIEALGRRAALHPEKAALRCGEQCVSYGVLWNRIVTTACHFSDSGVHPSDRVALAAPSTLAFVYGYFASHLLGAVAVPIDPHAPASRREELIRRSGAALALGDDVYLSRSVPCPSKAIDELMELPIRYREFGLPGPDSLADLVFTTGTTGRPKGVRLTHGNLAAAASHINAVIGTMEGDVEVVPLPLYHSFGLGRLRCCLSAGATIVLVQGFRLPGEIFAAIERHGATGLAGVPAGFAVLLRFGERGLGPFAGSLRYVEIGSAPMPLEHKRALMELLPHTSLFMHYGLTEASRSAFLEFHRDETHLDTVGLPAPGVEIAVRDDSGKPCGAGEAGVLWIRGPHVSSGYWDDVELTATTFVDGWVRTGDVGHIDESGFTYLHGRRDDMVNVGGFNVSPDEVERVLAEHPCVLEAACIGVPDPRGIAGQVLRAFLVAQPEKAPVPDRQLLEWAAGRLEPYKIPTQYEWIAKLPRTASGKLVRATLRDQAAAVQ